MSMVDSSYLKITNREVHDRAPYPMKYLEEKTMSLTVKIFQTLEGLDPAVRSAIMAVLEEIEKTKKEQVTRDEFLELKEIVKDLALHVRELVNWQEKTEKILEELVQWQAKTEKTLKELAEAQKRTEERLEKLIEEHGKTRKHLGGLTHTVGYYLEDRAIWHLPALLKRDFNISVEGNLRRGFIEIKPSKYIEVNVWGEGSKNGEPIAILGEAKTQLKKSEVDEFMERVAKIRKLVGKEIFPVLITFYTTPQVQKMLKERGIALYFSYDLRD